MADITGPESNPDGLFQLVYFSRSLIEDRPHILAHEIWSIQEQARIRNRPANITGALYFSGTHFAQILEGTRPAVFLLMDRIRKDRRHDEITIVHEASTAKRDFVGWAMAYVDGTSEEVISLSPPRVFAGIGAGGHGSAFLDMIRYLVMSDEASASGRPKPG